MSTISSAARPASTGVRHQPITLSKPLLIPAVSEKTLYCDVVFGSPAMDCSGTGICKISGTNSVRQLSLKKDCRLTMGQIASAPDGKVNLFFFREFLCINLYRQHFRKGVLHLEEPCAIPSELVSALGLAGKKILPGSYPVVESEGYFRISLNLA